MKYYIYEDQIGFVEFEDKMGDDLAIVNAARVSYDKKHEEFQQNDEKLLKYLIKNGHWSPFDQAAIKFNIKAPKYVVAQHMRHQSQFFNEVSRRYVAVDFEFYNNPLGLRRQHQKNKQGSYDEFENPEIEVWFSNETFEIEHDSIKITDLIDQYHEMSLYLYETLNHAGYANEQVRGLLPQNMYSNYIATMTVRSAIHYLQQRLDSHAQWEHRKVAEAIETEMTKHFPYTMKLVKEVFNDQ